MRIVRRIKIYKKSKYLYYIDSPIIQTYYYLNEELGYGEVDVPLSIIKDEILKLLPKHYELFIVQLFAELLGCTIEKTQTNKIDGIIQRKKSPIAVIEVKLGEATKEDTKKFIDKTKQSGLKAKLIIVAKNKVHAKNVISMTPGDIIEILRNPSLLRNILK